MAKSVVLISLLFFLMLVPPSSSSSSWECSPQELSALNRFKQELLDPYYLLSSWKGTYCCSWKGVTCHPLAARVVGLDLPYSILARNSSSQIFPALFKLHHLEYLDLGGIDLSPLPFPSHLPMTLTRLTHLSFSYCGLAGSIPSDIGNMSSLTFLDMSANNFSGQIPGEIGNMSSLAFLDISYNSDLEFMQSSSWIRNLRGLEHLGLFDLNLTSDVVENVASLPNLASLSMQTSGALLPPLANLTSLSLLDIRYSNFTQQPFPTWISNLTSLASLYLYHCDLHGSIPSAVLRLQHLMDLRLSDNPRLDVNLSFIVQHAFHLSSLDIRSSNVGGMIPDSIGNLSRLEVLDLSENSLRGSIPWSSSTKLSKLSVLWLESNQLNGSFPSTFGNFSSLHVLGLSNNSLSGTFLLSQLENSTELSYLGLSNNLLRVKVEGSWIPKFQLEYLHLGSCNMDGDFPAFISTQYSIRGLDLSNNYLSGNIPDWLWDFGPFGTLNLSCNQFEGRPLSSRLGKFQAQNIDLHRNKLQGNVCVPHSTVEFLDVSENQFDGIIPSSIDKYGQSQLYYFSLANNNIAGSFPHSICGAHQLGVLDASNNKLTGNISASFRNCSSTLKVLNLENNSLEGEIRSMVCLQTLKLGSNRIEGSITSSLENCTSLEILDLGYNNMHGTIPNWIGSLVNLRILVLRSNKFKGGIPLELTKLENLQVLILSNNEFSGTIPSSLQNLRAMKNKIQIGEVLQYSNSSSVQPYVDKIQINNKRLSLEYVKSLALVRCLDLSNNNFSGDIPQDIGFLIGLMILNLSRDHLNGKLPTTLENLVLLESLDLSGNNLMGNIPIELQALTFLSYLDISCNNLLGRIPQGGQFLTFDEKSFSSNRGLCGLQINVSCSYSPLNKTYDEDLSEQELGEHIWWEVGIGISFGFGFSLVIGLLCFNKKCRTACFMVMDDIIVILDQTIRERIF